MAAAGRAAEDASRRDRWLAWHIGAFAQSGRKLPSARSFIGEPKAKKAPSRQMSADEIRAAFAAAHADYRGLSRRRRNQGGR